MADKITLVCTTLGKNPELLERMLDSAKGFDKTIVHTDQKGLDYWKNGYVTGFNDMPLPKMSIPEAYNYLIRMVDTQWVCCMCDDDYFYPEGLAKMIKEVHEGIVAGVAHFKFHVSGYVPPEDVRCWLGKTEYDLCEKKRITPELLRKHGRLPAASFFRKSAWEMAGGFQGEFEHDRNLWLRMAEKGVEFKYFDHLVYNFVRRDNSAWRKQHDSR